MEGLKLVIGGDVKEAEQALKTFSGSLTKLEKDVATFGGGVKKFTSTFNAGFTQLPATIKKTEVALSKLPRASNAATQSLINVGRVAQDLPFGMLGIANNINPLLESFQRLKAESGSTGGALKLLGASLIGGGGLGLAISVVTGLMSYFALSNRGAKDDVEKTSKAVDEAKKRQQEFQQALDKAAGSVISQAGELKALKNILVSVSNDYLTLNEAIIKQGLAQFLFSQKEGLVQKQLKDAIEGNLKVQKTMLDFRTQEFTVAKKTAELKPIRLASDAELKKAGITLTATEKQIFDINKLAQQLGISFEQFVKVPEKNKKTVDDFISKAKELASELEKIGFIQPQFSFFDSVNEQLEKAKKVFADFNSRNLKIDPKFFKIEPTFSEPRPEQVQAALSPVEQGIKSGIISLPPIEIPIEVSANFAANLIKNVNTDLTKAFQDIGIKAPDIDLEQTPGFNFNVQLDALRKFFNASQDITKEGLQNMAADFAKGVDSINKAIVNLQVEVLAGFGEALGAALTGGDIGNIFQGFANAVASGVQAIGKQFIALGAVALAAKESLKTLFANPFATIAAGVALVAVGSALKTAIGGGVPGFAHGGIVSGPTLALVGEGIGTSRSNPEVIAPLDQLKGMLSDMGGGGNQIIQIISKTRGRDLSYSIARTSRSQRRLGA